MSEEICKYVISRGPNKGTQCDKPALKDGYCKPHRELRSVKNTLRDQCRHVFVNDEAFQCEEKAVKDGYCESCLELKEVQVELSTRCQHILTKGRNAGNRCVNPAFDQGYCEVCLKKRIVQARLAEEKPKRRLVIEKKEVPRFDVDELNGQEQSSDEEIPRFVVERSDDEVSRRCRLCHSERLFAVTVTGPSGTPNRVLDPEDGFLEGLLCLNCGLLEGKWPLPEDD
jgi:hypothetical protein